jgi:hypothetical protein
MVLLGLGLFMNWKVGAQSDNFVLEVEKHWETFGVGGTCIPGTHDLAVADVDGDGVKEMVTGGFSYSTAANGSRTTTQAPLKIWSWNGQNLTLEHSENWAGNIWVVYAGDAEGDGKTEIITSGGVINSAGSDPTLRFWNWDGNKLVLRGSYGGISVTSIFVGNVDKDGKPEVVTVGRPLNATQAVAQLSVWQWDGENLTLKKSVEWCSGADARANSVYACDLNNDGLMEIMTGGYDNGLKNSSGQLRVWQWDRVNLSLKANAEWRMVDGYAVDVAGNPMGNTVVNNVKVGDVDSDGHPEIITGGFGYDGVKVNGQLRIWNWSGGVLNLEKSTEWVTSEITELKSITINDVDGDGKTEIVTSGVTAGYGSFALNATDKEQAQLRVWSWDGSALTLRQSKDWIVGEGVCAWQAGTGDLDNDGAQEIVTVGCMYIGNLCDPDLRIWSLSVASTPSQSVSFPYLLVAIAGIAAVAVVALVLRRRK